MDELLGAATASRDPPVLVHNTLCTLTFWVGRRRARPGRAAAAAGARRVGDRRGPFTRENLCVELNSPNFCSFLNKFLFQSFDLCSMLTMVVNYELPIEYRGKEAFKKCQTGNDMTDVRPLQLATGAAKTRDGTRHHRIMFGADETGRTQRDFRRSIRKMGGGSGGKPTSRQGVTVRRTHPQIKQR
ncbi:hypothetical protein EVAR_36209_1 [Eumeta japonica]|uniref:Uncharacterized protein n=1 Tax=Eumeta variegata TaxID=151549 RepID=A0A4C1VRZ3_EUMVA|nr:hypothetical protein EVAR_36209_1 [Eumeta japonica]